MGLWEGRAIPTPTAVARISETPESKGDLSPALKVNVRDGGLKRFASVEEDSWWSGLRITQEKSQSPLKFALFTSRARTEIEEVLEPQRATALIKGAIKSTALDKKVSQALFEML